MEQEGTAYKKLILSIVLTGISAFGAQYCIQPVIKLVAAYYGRGSDGAGIIMGASLMGMAVMLLALVAVSDRLPIKKCILASLCTTIGTTLATYFIESFYLFVAIRFLQGAVLALVPILTIRYARQNSPLSRQGFSVSMYICGVTLGGLSGRLVMGFLTDFMPWKNALLLLGSFYAILVVAEFHLLLDDKKNPQPADKPKASRLRLRSREGAALIAICCFGFCYSDCFFIIFNYVPYIFSAPPYNFSNTMISLIYLIQIFGSVGSFVAGRLHARFGPYKITYTCLTAIGCGALLALLPAITWKMLGLVIITMFFFAIQAMGGVMSSGISEEHRGSCTAAYMFTFYMGGGIITSIGGYLYKYYGWNSLIAVELVLVTSAGLVLAKFMKLRRALDTKEGQ